MVLKNKSKLLFWVVIWYSIDFENQQCAFTKHCCQMSVSSLNLRRTSLNLTWLYSTFLSKRYSQLRPLCRYTSILIHQNWPLKNLTSTRVIELDNFRPPSHFAYQTRRMTFSACHRLNSTKLSEAENKEVLMTYPLALTYISTPTSRRCTESVTT